MKRSRYTLPRAVTIMLLLLLLSACRNATGQAPAPTAPFPATAAPVPAEAPAAAMARAPTEPPVVTTAPAPTAVPAVPLRVIATYSILGDLVQNVAGDRVMLTTLVGPDGDPHVYEPTPADSAALAEADLIFENGLVFETWIDDLYTASDSSATRVVVSDEVDPLPAAEEHNHDDPLAHACEHFDDTPTPVTAAASSDAEPVAIPDDHTHYQVSPAAGEGLVAVPVAEAGELSFYLGADVNFELQSGDAVIAPERVEPVNAGCDAIAVVYTYDLAAGPYLVRLGPGADTPVALVWETADHAHDEEAEHGHAEDEHGHQHGEYDPHIWNDPNNAMLMVEAIRDALAQADPNNAIVYADKAAAYLAQLEALDAFIRAETKALAPERRKLVTTHDTFGYFADRYGYEVVGTALGITTEAADPAAGKIAALVEQIRAAGVPAIFAESSNNPALMERIAQEAGVTLAPPLYAEALSEPGGPAPTYLDMVRYNVTTMVSALGA